MVDINDYNETRVCDYKGRRYHVRDNGAIYREAKQGSRPSKLDEMWTFGKFDPNTGYMLIGSERVHRIVCTAFHGEPEGRDYVVDHIDTIHTNNSATNLRWLTRFENILKNPITMARVEMVCGSKEAFIANPGLLFGHESKDPNFMWMKDISPQEAKNAYERMKAWAQKPIEERQSKGGTLGKWIVRGNDEDPNSPFYGFKRWSYKVLDRTEESYFPLSPLSTVAGGNILQKYQQALVPGKVFLVSKGYKTVVSEVVFFPSKNRLRVLSEREGGSKGRWYIFEIWPDGNTLIHKYAGTYSANHLKEAREAVKDLTKYHRQEWKYGRSKLDSEDGSSINQQNTDSFLNYLAEFCGEDELDFEGIDDTLYDSLTVNAKQKNWRSPCEFVCCPQPKEPMSIKTYFNNLKEGERFAQDRYGHYSSILSFSYNERNDSLYILTRKTNGLNPFGLCQIVIEDGYFIHDNLGTFDKEDTARLAFSSSLTDDNSSES